MFTRADASTSFLIKLNTNVQFPIVCGQGIRNKVIPNAAEHGISDIPFSIFRSLIEESAFLF